jgi:hypothetical protein
MLKVTVCYYLNSAVDYMFTLILNWYLRLVLL